MTTTSPLAPVSAEAVVPVDPATAFDWYVHRPGRRHPAEGLSGRPSEIVYEPVVGGRWYERSDDGAEHDWGLVLEWDPPRRLVLAWMVGAVDGEWRFDPDPTHASRAELTFDAVEGGTRVRVVHDGLEAHGTGAESIRRGASTGWPEDLRDLARCVEDLVPGR
ncbi:MAG: SRPBCC domain-containing protein [Acidimicrobiales bacterium]|nr:SRPBCC domain-containing protein [Acidimicrobiales bacterium]MCB9395873.1 SRPBCC domain-containing protein [Acidimicrobiaceae bacterium]